MLQKDLWSTTVSPYPHHEDDRKTNLDSKEKLKSGLPERLDFVRKGVTLHIGVTSLPVKVGRPVFLFDKITQFF